MNTRPITVAIIHFGEPAYLNEIISSLSHSEIQILVIDHNKNGFFRADIQYLHNPENPGYAHAVNTAIQLAMKNHSRTLVVLNNDLSVTPACITTLDKEIHSTGCYSLQATLLSNQNKVLCFQNQLYPFFHWSMSPQRHFLPESLPAKIQSTDFICGACFAVNLFRYQETPVKFDESFFLYFEDIEWSLRLKKSGFPLYCSPNARCIHYESSSTGGHITKKGILLRYHSLKLYLKLSSRSSSYSLLSIFFFWCRMFLLWGKYGFR